jgi:TolB protein
MSASALPRGLLLVIVSSCLFAAPAQSSPNRIAYVDQQGDLYTIQPDGEGRRKLASGEILQPVAFSTYSVKNGRDFYSWPLWSPDGNRLACFRMVADENERADGLYVFDVASARVLNAYKRADLQPIYAYWAPDSRQLAVLLGGSGALSLGLWPTSESEGPKSVAHGAPFYFDWRADAQALLIHTGGDSEATEGHSVSLLQVDSGKRLLVSRSPASFGPPSWSPDGKWLAYGDKAAKGDKTQLMVAAADGSAAKSFGEFPEKIALAWSPARPVLAVATSSFVGDPLQQDLHLIEVPSGETRTVLKEHFAAYFWSPDGERILYAKRKPDTHLWTWVVVDVRDGASSEVVDFVPARPMLVVFQYFDQYALSHRLWSPDGKQFVFTGSAGKDAHPATAVRNPSVFVVDAAKGATPKALSDGHIAFWSRQ